MGDVLFFVDDGFYSKLKKYFGKGKYLRLKLVDFCRKISKRENLFCKHIYFYTAPPFQSKIPVQKEKLMKKGYDKLIKALKKEKVITVREGRCQKIINESGIESFAQKGVDSWFVMDLCNFKEIYPEIKKVILIASDSDFVPTIRLLKSKDIEIILYTYFERKRNSVFSTSNHLLKAVSKYVQLSRKNFKDVEYVMKKELGV